MKKVFCLLTLAALSVGAAGCGGAAPAQAPANVVPLPAQTKPKSRATGVTAVKPKAKPAQAAAHLDSQQVALGGAR